MKKSFKKLSFAILFLVTMVNLQAQSNMEYNVYAGLSTAGLFNTGHTLSASINPIWAKTDNFKLESRLGYSYTNVSDTYMSGDTGTAQWTIVQVGPRYVFRSVDKKFRPAINVLCGYSHLLNTEGEAYSTYDSGFSMAINLEAELGRMIFGISIDGAPNEIPTYLGLKAGFKF